MEDTLKDDGKGSIEKLNKIINDLESIYNKKMIQNVALSVSTYNQLRKLMQLRDQNWGRISQSFSETILWKKRLHLDENDFMVRQKL